jgi:hypothetical protein
MPNDQDQVWRPLSSNGLGILNAISNSMLDLETKCPNILTSVRRGPRLIMTSDYSGQHSSAKAEVYSFLLVDAIYLWLWDEMRRRFRCQYLPNRRRMAYKGLNDRKKLMALMPFLRITNCIPGLLMVFFVDKRINKLLNISREDILRSGALKLIWKARVLERLFRVASFASLLMACMSERGQDLLWFTDEDDIVANEDRLRDALELIGRFLGNLLPHPLGHMRFGSTRSDDGSLGVEDLTAIPDLVSGAVNELGPFFIGIDLDAPAPQENLFREIELPEKAQVITSWFMDGTQHPLRKIIVQIIKKDDSQIARVSSFQMGGRRPEYCWRPEARNALAAR